MYVIKGIVIHGRKLGRKLGFPTANIVVDSALNVEDGVYAAEVVAGERTYEGMANLGYRPSVENNESERLLEVNLFDFNGNLYGNEIEVSLIHRIRPEARFANLEELKNAVDEDRRRIENYFREFANQ